MTTYSHFKCTVAALEDLAKHSPDGIRVTGFGLAPAVMAGSFFPASLIASDLREPLRTVCPKFPVPQKLRSKVKKSHYKVTEMQGGRDLMASWLPHSPLQNSPVRGFWLLSTSPFPPADLETEVELEGRWNNRSPAQASREHQGRIGIHVSLDPDPCPGHSSGQTKTCWEANPESRPVWPEKLQCKAQDWAWSWDCKGEKDRGGQPNAKEPWPGPQQHERARLHVPHTW